MTPLASLWLPILVAAWHHDDPAFLQRRARWQPAIWYNRSRVTTLESTVHGLVYGTVIAGAFAWLWPR